MTRAAVLSRALRQPRALNGYAVESVRTPMRDGAILAPDRAVGIQTWEDFLAQRVPQAAARRAA